MNYDAIPTYQNLIAQDHEQICKIYVENFDIDNWPARVCIRRPKPPLAVRFNLEKTTIHQYTNDDENVSSPLSRRRSRSDEASRLTTDKSIEAFRRELNDAMRGVIESINGVRSRRDNSRISRDNDIYHLINIISINKTLAQSSKRKKVVRAVLNEQARQRQSKVFDHELVAMKSLEHTKVYDVNYRAPSFVLDQYL